MTDFIDLVVEPQSAGRRLDAYLADRLEGISRSRIQALLDGGRILLNRQPARASRRLASGDTITGTVDLPPGLSARPQRIPLTVVYRDADVAIIDKPAGLVVHPAPGHEQDTLANGLMALFPEAASVGDRERPGIVHRLDKDTSGLMVVALSSVAQHSLQRQIAKREAGREYVALVRGLPRPTDGVIDAPIGRDRADRKRMAVYGTAARSAQTTYRVVEKVGAYSLVHATLQTGRTHQIRVHLAATGHPVAGDITYGGPLIPGLSRQFLHAMRLSLRSPSTGEELVFESPLPPDLQRVLESLRQMQK